MVVVMVMMMVMKIDDKINKFWSRWMTATMCLLTMRNMVVGLLREDVFD